MPAPAPSDHATKIATIGFSGMLVNFSQTFSDGANRAALAFRAHLDASPPVGVTETSTSLTSVYIAFNPEVISHAEMHTHLEGLLDTQNWLEAALPDGRRLWRIPTVFGGDHGPQLTQVAEAVDKTNADTIAALSTTRLRVLTLGFAPGQPYLGTLPEGWHIPRQSGLTPRVPKGAVTTAISQIVLFTIPAPTGWRQVGLTAFEGFKLDRYTPFALRPGDEVTFPAISPEEYDALGATNTDGMGGATAQTIP